MKTLSIWLVRLLAIAALSTFVGCGSTSNNDGGGGGTGGGSVGGGTGGGSVGGGTGGGSVGGGTGGGSVGGGTGGGSVGGGTGGGSVGGGTGGGDADAGNDGGTGGGGTDGGTDGGTGGGSADAGTDGGSNDAGTDAGIVPNAARGEYLVKGLLFCGNCHTTKTDAGVVSTDPADFLAGGTSFNFGLNDAGTTGKVFAPNLTPDVDAGLGNWTTAQIRDAIRTGIDSDGFPLATTMPYQVFANLSDFDATSIALYLQSLPPSPHVVPERTAVVTMAQPVIDGTLVAHTTLAPTDSNYASAEAGRYLALIGCLDCHTTRVTDGGQPPQILSQAFAGGRAFGSVKSTNLTPDVTGLMGWTTSDFIDTIESGHEKGDAGQGVCSPMPVGMNGFGQLTTSDLTDLGNFILTLPPITNGPFHVDGGC